MRRAITIAALLLCLTAFLLLLGLSYGFGSPFHYSDDIHFRVIDESTGQPLAGVAVLAVWSLEAGIRSDRTSFIYYLGNGEVFYKSEALSNANGDVVVPGMPPRLRPPLRYFTYRDPRLVIYKPGYASNTLTNIGFAPGGWQGPFDTNSAKRRSYWEGQTIPLAPAQDARIEAETLRYVVGSAGDARAFPPKFAHVWATAAQGFRRIPVDVRQDFVADPQDVIHRRRE